MYVRRVELTDFRSYERLAVDLDPGVSVLVGQNGMGKTNLIEALGYVATLDSHRVATDAPLVRAGAASAVIRCAIVHDGRELLVELEIVPGKANRARLNRSPVRRSRDVLGALRLALFAPEDLELVRGDPELAKLKGYAEDTGEGRWTVDEAVRLAVPLHVIAASLFTRFESRQIDSPAMKAVAALRQQFGGHAVVG